MDSHKRERRDRGGGCNLQNKADSAFDGINRNNSAVCLRHSFTLWARS